MAKNRIGIDIDGGTLRIVEVDEAGNAVAWRTVHGTDPVDALNRYSSKGDINLAVWSGNNTYLRPVQIVEVPDDVVQAAMQDAADENLPAEPGSLAVVGRKIAGEATEGHREPALIAGIGKADLENVWEPLLTIGANLSVPQMCTLPDGLHLVLRRSVTELLLVTDGIPVQHRQFTMASLDKIADNIEDEDLKNMIATGVNLPQAGATPAADAIARQVEELVGEVRRTIEFWQRSGTAIPSQLQVSGVGVAMPGLAEALAAAGFSARAAAVPETVNLRNLGAETLAYYSAALAAVAQDVPTFENPVAVERAAAAAKRAKRRQLLIFSVAAVFASAVMLTAPVVVAKSQRNSAEDKRNQARSTLDGLSEAVALQAQANRADQLLHTLGNHEPVWHEIIPSLEATAAPGSRITDAKITPVIPIAPPVASTDPAAETAGTNAAPTEPHILVALTARLPGNDFSVVADWIEALKDAGAYDVISSNFGMDDNAPGTVIVNITMKLPATTPWVEPRYADLMPETAQDANADDSEDEGSDSTADDIDAEDPADDTNETTTTES